ncbi:unnamed protein product, partial [Phaeothamnion confervicola]
TFENLSRHSLPPTIYDRRGVQPSMNSRTTSLTRHHAPAPPLVHESGAARRRLEVSIPASNLKTFAYAVQCLGKVGKELFLEGTSQRLILRTLNDAKSCFCAFYFVNNGFFETFSSEFASQTQGGGNSRSVSCKILIKAVYNILRTLRNVVRLVIFVEEEDDAHIEPCLGFQVDAAHRRSRRHRCPSLPPSPLPAFNAGAYIQMHCDYGIRKQHRFGLQDCEVLSAMFNRNEGSQFMCPPAQLSQLFEHIHGAAEVAVMVRPDVLCVRSYHHEAVGMTSLASRAVLNTEMSIASSEFDEYRFEPPQGSSGSGNGDDAAVELIFSLKEVRALLAFCEQSNADNIGTLFTGIGCPVMFQTLSKTYSAELILATMEPRVPPSHDGARSAVPAAAPRQPSGTAVAAEAAATPAGGSQGRGSSSQQQWQQEAPPPTQDRFGHGPNRRRFAGDNARSQGGGRSDGGGGDDRGGGSGNNTKDGRSGDGSGDANDGAFDAAGSSRYEDDPFMGGSGGSGGGGSGGGGSGNSRGEVWNGGQSSGEAAGWQGGGSSGTAAATVAAAASELMQTGGREHDENGGRPIHTPSTTDGNEPAGASWQGGGASSTGGGDEGRGGRPEYGGEGEEEDEAPEPREESEMPTPFR